MLTALFGLAAAQYSDPASHGFTINAPGLTNTATFGYGAGLSPSSSAQSRPATTASASYVPLSSGSANYVPLSSGYVSQPRVTLTEKAFTLTNVGSVGGPTGSVIGERRLLTGSNAVLPRQSVGAGVPSRSGLGTTVVSLSNRGSGSAPAPLPDYFGGNSGRIVSTSRVSGSPFNPTIQREPPRFQYAVSFTD